MALLPFRRWLGAQPVIPEFYLNVETHEERLKHMACLIDGLERYVNYLQEAFNQLEEDFEGIRDLYDELEKDFEQFKKDWEEFRDSIETRFSEMEAAWKEFKDAMETAWSEYQDKLDDEQKTYEETMNKEWSDYKDSLDGVSGNLQKAWEEYKAAMEAAWNEYIDRIDGKLAQMDTIASEWNSYKDAMDAAWNSYKDMIDGEISDINSRLNSAVFFVNGTAPIHTEQNGAGTVTVSHDTSGVDVGSYGPTKDMSPAFGDTVAASNNVSVNATGHVTDAATYNLKIPDTAVSSSSSGLMTPDMYKNLSDLISSNNPLVEYVTQVSAPSDWSNYWYARVFNTGLVEAFTMYKFSGTVGYNVEWGNGSGLYRSDTEWRPVFPTIANRPSSSNEIFVLGYLKEASYGVISIQDTLPTLSTTENSILGGWYGVYHGSHDSLGTSRTLCILARWMSGSTSWNSLTEPTKISEGAETGNDYDEYLLPVEMIDVPYTEEGKEE